MGPFANLVFAFLVFCGIWATGGREKSYADVTNRIGWVDPQSELYKAGIRPGDIILRYDNEKVRGAKDHFHAAMTATGVLHVAGLRWDPAKMAYVSFDQDIHPYPHPQAIGGGILTTGILSPASFIIYPKKAAGAQDDTADLPAGSPLVGSGIERGDRIIWLNGESVYSLTEMSALLNDGKCLLTIQRDGKTFLRRVPRVALEDLKLTSQEREELTDWQYEADLRSTKLARLFFIPYNLTPDCKVENEFKYIDNSHPTSAPFSDLDTALQAGDTIIAIDGTSITSSTQLLKELQTPKALVIVERMPKELPANIDQFFDAEMHSKNLLAITKTIGTSQALNAKGALILLKPVIPKTRLELFQSQGKPNEYTSEIEEEKKHIQALDDPEKRQLALKFLETRQKQLLLGLPGVEDLSVNYNPNPFQMFSDVVDEVAKTLSALVGGYLNPKWISGPVGIVQVIHQQWMTGVKEALFWIAAISLNLGLLNLLPLPVLDGGYICLSLFEIVSGKKLKAKTIEKIVIPFAVLLISFFVFLTYHDLLRLLANYIGWSG
jgi:regulator of sigma E protease